MRPPPPPWNSLDRLYPPTGGIKHKLVFLLGMVFVFLAGCETLTTTGSINIRSLSEDPVELTTNFRYAFFSHDPNSETSIWLSDVSVSELMEGDVTQAQILHVELLWIPRPGSTPIDIDATNASIRYVIVTQGQVGVYIGAGFAMPSGKLDGSKLGILLQNVSLELADSTDGLIDLLSPARLSGSFTATNDPEQVRLFRLAASQLVTDALGRTRFVMVSPESQSISLLRP